jgi:hypothetical protein
LANIQNHSFCFSAARRAADSIGKAHIRQAANWPSRSGAAPLKNKKHGGRLGVFYKQVTPDGVWEDEAQMR